MQCRTESQFGYVVLLYAGDRILRIHLTRGGVKPQPKKVQTILAANPPNNIKELRQFHGMVQYYGYVGEM
jgi:hypothetical protein